jgi:radical SAM protein with 4Fe4S-binding SPASM domain
MLKRALATALLYACPSNGRAEIFLGEYESILGLIRRDQMNIRSRVRRHNSDERRCKHCDKVTLCHRGSYNRLLNSIVSSSFKSLASFPLDVIPTWILATKVFSMGCNTMSTLQYNGPINEVAGLGLRHKKATTIYIPAFTAPS